MKFVHQSESTAKTNHLISYVSDLEHLKETLTSGLGRGWFDAKHTVIINEIKNNIATGHSFSSILLCFRSAMLQQVARVFLLV